MRVRRYYPITAASEQVWAEAEGLTPGAVLEPAPKGKAYAKFKSMAEVEAKSKGLQAIIKQMD